MCWSKINESRAYAIVCRLIAYAIIICGYSFILTFSLSIRDATPVGACLIIGYTSLFYLIYIALNHLLLSKLIKHQISLAFEICLLISMIIVSLWP